MPQNDLYKELGIAKGASKSEIKKAYRNAAKKAHPDIKGGNPKKFGLIKKAFDILSDDDHRSKYDSTGDDLETEPDNERSNIINYIAFAINMVLAECARNGQSPLEIHLVSSVIGKINVNISEAESNIRVTRGMMDIDKKLLGRFSSDKDNVFENIIKHRLKEMQASIAKMEESLETGKSAKELIQDVKFRKDNTAYESPGDRMMRAMGASSYVF